MPLTAIAGTNQHQASRDGTWMHRQVDIVDVAGDAIGEHVMFNLEKNCVVLDYMLRVVATTAAAGTATVEIKNAGGDVAIGASHSLTAAAGFMWNRTTTPGRITDQATTPVVLQVASLTAAATCTVLLSILVARIDFDL